MKQRVSALDLQLLFSELRQKLEGHRLTNVYNIADSSRQFLLKLNKTNSKFSVVIDCGLRIHTSDFNRPIPPAPSGFVVKLRKHLKSKRLTALRQVTNDRILVLQFADGLYYLVLEFFSAGNVILLDENRKILSLQRIVHEHENKVGEVYNMFDESIFKPVNDTPTKVSKCYTHELVKEWLEEVQSKFKVDSSLLLENKSEDKRKVKVMSIHKLLLSKEPHLSSDLLSKNLKIHGINPSSSSLEFLERMHELVKLLKDTEIEFNALLSNDDRKGFILAKENVNYNPEKDNSDIEYIYETFHPFKPYVDASDLENTKVIEVQGDYNKTLDAFFSRIESSKYALRIQNQEQQAKKKLSDARTENEKKIEALLNLQSSNEQKGHLIIENANVIEEVKLAIQGLIDQQMDWNTIETLIGSEQKKNNQIAKMIMLPLHLKDNKINVFLPIKNYSSDDDSSDNKDSSSDSSDSSDDSSDNSDSDFSDSETKKSKQILKCKNQKPNRSDDIEGRKVSIDLGLTAYANASQYFNIKKTTAEKQKKVEKNVEKAMKNIEERIDQQLKKKLKESHEVLKKIRTPYFFERHNWFISSEGFLVLMGKSPMETDEIYSKYIEYDDLYMTNSFGTQVWIKNPEKTEIPPNTLMQAGVLCMSASEAWSKKIASSPWWCLAKNVSKFDQGNKNILSPGDFRIIDDKIKNFLSPTQLVMGFALLWKVKTDDNEIEEEQEKRNIEIEAETLEELDEDMKTSLVDNDDESFFNMSEGADTIADLKSNQPIVEDPLDFDATATVMSFVENMNKNVRGKKGKLKKMQKKYADQDDNERLIRLEALGTLKGIEKQQQKEKEDVIKQEYKEMKKIRREKQKELQALSFTKNEKVKIDYEKFRSELKPCLDKNDEVLDIVPVFAPWPALLKYKYKVKIQPGTAKKTKTMNEILRYFMSGKVDTSYLDKEMSWPNEYEILKTLKSQDLVLALCVDKLKITIPGQNANKSDSKSNGKSKSKSGKKKK